MTKHLMFLCVTGILCISSAGKAADKTVRFVTFEAPPFMSEKLPEQGAFSYLLKKLFAKKGYKFEVRFAPLQRAKTLAANNKDIVGYFPVSPFELAEQFVSSKPVYASPWMIAERKEKSIVWEKPDDLKKYVGGNVIQYTLPPEYTKLIQTGAIKVEGAPDDSLNLLKLANKRIDYVFVDGEMFKFITNTDPRLKVHAKYLQLNAKMVGMLEYTVGFKKDPRSQKVLADFNKLVNREDINKLLLEYLTKYNMIGK